MVFNEVSLKCYLETHPAKFDNFRDENISDYKTVSVAQSKLAGLKTGGVVEL